MSKNKKIILDSNMILSLQSMIESNDSKDAKMGWTIIRNRDITNEDSEKEYHNFNENLKQIILGEKLSFGIGHHSQECWIIKYQGKILQPAYTTMFTTKQGAIDSLTRSLSWMLVIPKLKIIFEGSATKFRNFLLDNNIITIINILENE